MVVSEDSVIVPLSRRTALKRDWDEICSSLVNRLSLDCMYNTKEHKIHFRTNKETEETNAMQKARNYIDAYMRGFRLVDCVAFLRLDNIIVESFNVNDAKAVLKGANQSRAIGRICGVNGDIKNQIMDCTRTRIVVAGKKIHILGTPANNAVARRAMSQLIIGTKPGKIITNLQTYKERQM
ncbi:KH domain [Carpediemonas membranifera]|uniref:KH domain n=1 Tax=Carpediemonas membranifera TaxID=201153 RepID=A0A8J6E989_9EUKA|nr:KH domain [Carpediemonas membranifera]|eukprot:KAG9392980.1 KH domain [Carpediemonas membranifera]